MDMTEVVILLVRDPLSSLTEPNNMIRLLCSRVDRLPLSRAITQIVIGWERCSSELGNIDIRIVVDVVSVVVTLVLNDQLLLPL